MAFTRETYKKVKKMDRHDMEEYLKGIYLEGKTAGVKEGYDKGLHDGYDEGIHNLSKVVAPRIEKAIKNTPGIGEKRFSTLIDNITRELTTDLTEEEKQDNGSV